MITSKVAGVSGRALEGSGFPSLASASFLVPSLCVEEGMG